MPEELIIYEDKLFKYVKTVKDGDQETHIYRIEKA